MVFNYSSNHFFATLITEESFFRFGFFFLFFEEIKPFTCNTRAS